jgi:hypothetical protein
MPYADQWVFLSTIRTLSRSRVEQIVAEGERRGHIVGLPLPTDEEGPEPWTQPPSRRRSALSVEGDCHRASR